MQHQRVRKPSVPAAHLVGVRPVIPTALSKIQFSQSLFGINIQKKHRGLMMQKQIV